MFRMCWGSSTCRVRQLRRALSRTTAASSEMRDISRPAASLRKCHPASSPALACPSVGGASWLTPPGSVHDTPSSVTISRPPSPRMTARRTHAPPPSLTVIEAARSVPNRMAAVRCPDRSTVGSGVIGRGPACAAQISSGSPSRCVTKSKASSAREAREV